MLSSANQDLPFIQNATQGNAKRGRHLPPSLPPYCAKWHDCGVKVHRLLEGPAICKSATFHLR